MRSAGRTVALNPVSAPDATEPVRAGSLLCGRYQVIRLIAQGGMAVVWEAHDQVLARAVAIKVLHPHLAQDRLFQERFRREAISAARLAHPNVVATFDAGITDHGTAFIVMELIRGRTLSAFAVDQGPLPVFVVIQIAMQIADALAHAHAAGLVHRDIKPANVLVCDVQSRGVPLIKVTDFGIAKAAEGIGIDLTKTGTVLGTPRYLSPEQIEGREPDARTDLYSLGVVMFEMLTGEPPFRGPTELAVAVQHINAVPPRLAQVRPGLPPALDDLVAGLLAKRPQDRPPSALVVRRVLDGIDPGATETLFWRSGPPVQSRGGGAMPGAGGPGDAGNGAVAGPVGRPGPGAGAGVGPSGSALPGGPAPPVNPGDGPNTARPAGGPSPSPRPYPPNPGIAPTWHQPGGPDPARSPTRFAPGARNAPTPTRVAGPAPPPTGPPVRPGGPRDNRDPNRRGGPPPPGRPNWTGRFVAALVVAALLVVVIVVSLNGSAHHSSPPTGPESSATGQQIAIQNVSVFHLERDADGAANVSRAYDGNPNTAWTTDHYFGPNFGNLRHGLGLAITIGDSQQLHSLTVTSPTTGWSAEVYLANAVPSPPSLASWGPPLDTKQGINGSATFNLHGRTGRAILLWLTDLGPNNQAAVAELSLR